MKKIILGSGIAVGLAAVISVAIVSIAGVSAGCDRGCSQPGPETSQTAATRVAALADEAWAQSEWISAADAPTFDGTIGLSTRAASGTSWFARTVVNEKQLVSATWMTAGLGVYEIYVNGKAVGNDFLKPGFTHYAKTKYSFTYDITALMKSDAGEANTLAAEVSAGWWRDKITTPQGREGGFVGRKSAFRGVLRLVYSDGMAQLVGTSAKDWNAGTAGAVKHAAIFDGEEYDARVAQPVDGAGLGKAEVNAEFKGEIMPSVGAEVVLRNDLTLKPTRLYIWEGVSDANNESKEKKVFGTVNIKREIAPGEPIEINPGETLVVDFGQNCAAVPRFHFAAKAGTTLTFLPAEMLNDANGERSRGNDGPAGSVYRENLRAPHKGMVAKYTFKGDAEEAYMPRFTFFGYRYASVTATDKVVINSLESVPVSSITKEMELGKIETGDKAVNRLIANVYWGQLSNYLSVPMDCPQRNERLGWSADTQVFTEAGSFNADTRLFFHKWMRDLVDTQHPQGGFPGVAPLAQYGGAVMRFGWSDAGVIVPYRIWKQFGDTKVVTDNWAALGKYMARVNETRYEYAKVRKECGYYQWSDWLSFEKLMSREDPSHPECTIWTTDANGKREPKPEAILYWEYLGACYWLWDAQMMARMAAATGKDAAKYERMATNAKAYLKNKFFASDDGLILPIFRNMQTPALFALKLGLVEGSALKQTKAALRQNVAAHGGCLQTGFLGTSILMDTLTENGMSDLAYALLLNHNFPGWLYSVDQGATTIWERWNSYTKKDGFGPVNMNSFNHYAYGAVLAWIYKTAAGIAADPAAPGFKRIIMKPVPDRRLGHVTAEYKSAAGLIKSAWKYEGDKWVWTFTVPAGATASVTLPGETTATEYPAGTHTISR